MAVAAQAALLDELMGKGRNVAIGNLTLPHWSDEEICKNFLAGLCPHDLFTNTKDDLGLCDKVHDQSMLDNYKKSKRFRKMKYEETLCSYLNDLISSVENRIRRGQNRLKRNGSLVHSNYNSEREDKLEELNDNISETLAKVEKLGIEGKVQESQVFLELAENLKNEKARLEREIEVYNLQAKELEVCLICGAFQVKGDAQQRIEEHLQADFASVSEKDKLIEEELEKKRRSESRKRKEKHSKKSSSSYKSERRPKSRSHKRKRSKSKDNKHVNSKTRDRSRENEKHSSKYSSRSKNRESRSSTKHRRRK